MRLKKLELFGFKSFADKTEILFDQGVTCVVGPNGCGKSNISDSIRWVLGERSAKLLRGSKMEDVIFNGTDYRKPLGYAEVALTIDNNDRGLPIDYQEVTLARRLYRSGESEYFMNKTSCRLKDIQDLILDTGIGSNSYSMIEQGRIDYILNANADERRFLIEEAAGISKYKVKKEEAIRKLERTEENRLRLNDIIHEVQKNIQYAERQAKRAARYREELEKLKNLEIRKAFHDLNLLAQEKNRLEQNRIQLDEQREGLERQMQDCRQKQEALVGNLNQITEQYRTAEQMQYEIQSKMEQNEQRLRFHQEKKVEIAARRGQIEEEASQLKNRIQQAEKEIAEQKIKIHELEDEKKTIFLEIENSESALHGVAEELLRLKTSLEQIKSETFQAASEAARIRNEYHRLAAFLESSSQQKKRHEAGIGKVRIEAEDWRTRKGSFEKEIAQLDEKLKAVEGKRSILNQQIHSNQSSWDVLEKETESTERKLHEQQTRLQMLLEIDAAFEANAKELLEESGTLHRNLIKTLAELITVKPGYEWALEIALESFSRAFVADNLKTAEQILQRLIEKKKFSLGIFLKSERSVAAAAPLHHPRLHHALSDLVTVSEIHPSMEPFLKHVYLVDEMPLGEFLDEFFPLASTNGYKFIRKDGICLGPYGRIFYRNAGTASENSPFQRRSEMEYLQKEIPSLQGSIAASEQRLGEFKTKIDLRGSELKLLEAEKMDFAIQKESFESLRRSADEQLESFKRELELFEFESRELNQALQEAGAQKINLEESLRHAEERDRQLKDEQEQLLHSVQASEAKKIQMLQSLTGSKAQWTHLEDRNHFFLESLARMKDHYLQDSERIALLGQEFTQLQEKEVHLEKEDVLLHEEQLQLDRERRKADVSVELFRQEKEKMESERSGLLEIAQRFSQKTQETQSAFHQIEMKLMEINYQEKNIAERVEQAYRVKLADLKVEDFSLGEDSLEGVQNKIQELKNKVESLGTVNLLAIEEYEELKQRYDFLLNQQKDLDEAREQLMETIRKINKTTKGLFEETFANVQKTFQEYYQILFRGGHAQLVLIDETNPLESGIDIVVRPPGKKLQHISLLSGGEKALTAIALLFALFKIKPSPFCVLDEVDAPLDEANIDRFVAVLKTFVASSQFIIVTHNRKTIAMGDSLYGVTMEQPGVSKLVSVKISQDIIPMNGEASRKDAAEEIPA